MEKGKNSKGVIAILVIIIIILSVLVFLTGTGVLSFKSVASDNRADNGVDIHDNSSTKTNDGDGSSSSNLNVIDQKSSISKSQILSYYKEKLSLYDESNSQYSVVDINDDNIPELLIYVSGVIGNQIIADTSVYTYDENKGDELNDYIVFVGTINGRIDNNTILYKMKDGTLLSVFGHMGYETTARFKLSNDWLVRTDFSSRKTTEYITGDNEIEFISCSDTTLIDNFD